MRGWRHGAGDHHRASLREAHARQRSIDETAKLKRDISLKLTVLSRQLHRQFDQTLEDLEVTRSQWTAIAVVARRPGVTQRVIADLLDMSEAAAGRSVDRLCNDGLLERREKEDDKRAYRVFLTPAAQPILDRIGAIATKLEDRTFAGIANSDLEKLAALLNAIDRNINP